jgi:hypothetical protein
MADASTAHLVSELSDHDAERVLQLVGERLVQGVGELAADNEEDAREIIAASVTRYGSQPLSADDVAPAAVQPISLVQATLTLLADDPATEGVVRGAIADLPEETQMVVDPITIAVVLVGLVAFLQTKFSLKVRRKAGKVDVDFSISKDAASQETIKQVVSAVGRAASGS